MRKYSCFFFVLALFWSDYIPAQTTTVSTSTSLFSAMRARKLGPALTSGRISSIAIHPQDPTIVYIGAAGGGVWKTVSGGNLIRPVFDEHTQSIGKIAIAPSEPETIYVGTGEPWTRNSVSVGTGMYKSTNGGSTWKAIGLEKTERIADILVHPNNPDIVYVAALGHLWNAHESRGVFKTTDGGQSWEKILYIDENTGATDLDIDPDRPDHIYAVMWSFRRTPWSFDSGFTGGSAVYKSNNEGRDWQKIHHGLPDEKLGRMAIAVAPSNADVLYLSVECESEDKKGLYLSTDAGSNWEMVSSQFNTKVRPFYFSNIVVDPLNDSIVIKCGLNAIISEDRATTFRTAGRGTVHSDIHDIWIDPSNTKHILLATDGGIYESIDRGHTFKMWMNLPVSQFYRVSVDDAQPFNVYGGMQDNGSWVGPSRKAGGVANSDWQLIFGGDGFYTFRHPTEENIVFAELQGGNLVRFDKNTGQVKSIAPYRQDGEEDLRYNWNTPIHLSPNQPDRLYFASQYLYVSQNMGDSWKRISPDLTTDNPTKQRQFESGGLSIDNSTAENHCSIYAISESPKNDAVIWVGTDDGNLQLTSNGGESWTNVVGNIPNLPANTWVTFIEASPHDAQTAYVTFDGHRTGNNQVYLYKTTDLGKSWQLLSDHEALEGYALSVRQDLLSPDLLFLGTEFGLFISIDDGKSWARFSNNMPKAGVRDMVIHPRDHSLVMATHGRGIILIDDISPLRQITAEVLQQKIAFLASPLTILRDPGISNRWFGGSGNFVAANPSSAARVIYFNKKRHTFGKMYFEIYKNGEKIREIPAGKSAGINIVEMPTRLPKPRAAPTRNVQALQGSIFGPNMEAGIYEVRLIKGKDTYTSTFELAYDPDAPYSITDREKQREVTLSLYKMSENLAYIHHVYSQVQQQLQDIKGLKRKQQMTVEVLALKIKKTRASLADMEGDGYVNSKENIRELISGIYQRVSQFPGRPSASQIAEAERLAVEMASIQADFKHTLSTDVIKLNELLAKSDKTVIQWDDKEVFFNQQTGGSDAGSGQQIWKTNSMYNALNNTPLTWRWMMMW